MSIKKCKRNTEVEKEKTPKNELTNEILTKLNKWIQDKTSEKLTKSVDYSVNFCSCQKSKQMFWRSRTTRWKNEQQQKKKTKWKKYEIKKNNK